MICISREIDYICECYNCSLCMSGYSGPACKCVGVVGAVRPRRMFRRGCREHREETAGFRNLPRGTSLGLSQR